MSPYARRVYAATLLMVTGFTFLSRLTQIAPPSTRFVFLGAGVRLGLPSHPASRPRSCLRLGVSTTSSSRGLSPPIDRPCRAYSRVALAPSRQRRAVGAPFTVILRGERMPGAEDNQARSCRGDHRASVTALSRLPAGAGVAVRRRRRAWRAPARKGAA